MGKDGPSHGQSSDGSTPTENGTLTRGEIEAAMEANGLSRERLGDAEWERAVATEVARQNPPTRAPAAASQSSDVATTAFTSAFGGRGVGVATVPRSGKTAAQQQDYATYYAALHKDRLAREEWSCSTCEDAKFVRVTHRPHDVAVLGIARVVSEAIPCPDCNMGDTVPLYLSASRVQEDWLDLTIEDFRSLPGKERAREVVARWVADLGQPLPV